MFFFFSSRRRHTRFSRDWSSDVCSSDLIDRNVNTTNVCIANCKFCNFFRRPGHPDSYITDIETYKRKIEETFRYGGDQLLLQGGHHPDLGLKFYVDLFKQLKELYPALKLHSLGPPEIAHIAKLDG